MTANYCAQHSVCLLAEFPQDLCASPWLNSEITKFRFFHTERKTFSVTHGYIYCCCKLYGCEVRSLFWGGQRGAGAGRQLPGEEQERWAAWWRRKFSALTPAGQWPSRCCMQGLKQEEHSEMQRGNISPCLICTDQHTHCSGKVLIRPGGEFARRNSLVCWLWQFAALWKPFLEVLVLSFSLAPRQFPGQQFLCGQLFLNVHI